MADASGSGKTRAGARSKSTVRTFVHAAVVPPTAGGVSDQPEFGRGVGHEVPFQRCATELPGVVPHGLNVRSSDLEGVLQHVEETRLPGTPCAEESDVERGLTVDCDFGDARSDRAMPGFEEYALAVAEIFDELKLDEAATAYRDYLQRDSVRSIHEGYFSIDKKTKHLVDPTVAKRGEEEGQSSDVDAYDLGRGARVPSRQSRHSRYVGARGPLAAR